MFQRTLIRVIEPEDVVLAKDYPRASLQDNSLFYFPAIDIAERPFLRSHSDDSFMVLKETVFTQNMGTAELYVLWNVGFRRANTSETILNVVQ
jgi:hypothetical protein